MALPVTIPNTFANATSSIPLSQLDTNFGTLANAVNGLNSGSETLANLKATTANVGVLTVTGNATIGDASTDTVTLNSTLTANTAVIFAAGTSAAPSITTTGDPNTGIFFPAADTIAFSEGGVESMRIDSSGNVGIGTTSPNKGGVSRALTLNGTAGNIVEFCVSDTRVGWVYGDNNLTALSAGGSRYIALETNGTERMRINAGAPILCLSGGNTSATGTGIAFPATQSASTDANTLDDYEEGSWTPALYDGATNRNPTYQDGPSGTYQKIGKWVYLRWGFRINSKGTSPGSGEIRIYGLPFTSVNCNGYQEPGAAVGTGNLVTAANAGIARMVVVNSGTHLFGRVLNNADTTWTYNDLNTGSWIVGEVFYETTA